MEDSTFEAIYIGVYIFVFIAALSLTLYMFKSVNELANKAYEYGSNISNDLIEIPDENKESTLDIQGFLSLYYNYVSKDLYDLEDQANDGIIVETSLNVDNVKEMSKNEFVLKYNGDKFIMERK